MEEKQLKKMLDELFDGLSQYQERELHKIREQVNQIDTKQSVDYAIEMFVCDKEEVETQRPFYEPLIMTGMHDIVWGTGVVATVYIEAKWQVLKSLNLENTIYNAIITTNYESYPVKVSLHQNTVILEMTEKINYLMFQNDIDMPKVNDGYAKRFFDIHFLEAKDRLREDEKPESIKVLWGELEPYVYENKALMWNVRKAILRENAFPVAISDQKEVKYHHELLLNDKENAYLLELEQESQFQAKQREDKIIAMTMQKQYQNWTAYEIISTKEKYAEKKVAKEKPATEEKTMTEVHETQIYCKMTNRKKKSIFDSLRCYGRLCTEAEMYRNILSYEMAEYFAKIEVKQSEVFFYPKDEGYVMNSDAMHFILEDLAVIYPGVSIIGHLIEEGA